MRIGDEWWRLKITYTTTTVANCGRPSPFMNMSCMLLSQIDVAVHAPPVHILQNQTLYEENVVINILLFFWEAVDE